MNLRTKVSVVILVTATTAATAFPALSGASPVDDKRRQATELQRQIDANDNQLVMLSEQLNGARIRHDQAQAGIDEAQRRTDIAEGQRRFGFADEQPRDRLAIFAIEFPANELIGNRLRWVQQALEEVFLAALFADHRQVRPDLATLPVNHVALHALDFARQALGHDRLAVVRVAGVANNSIRFKTPSRTQFYRLVRR